MRSVLEEVSFRFITRWWLWMTLAGVMLVAQVGECYDCGGFVHTSQGKTGVIQSPGYPGGYPNYTRCIWILEAPDQHTPVLTVDFQGETFDGACSDKVEFRDGGRHDPVILINCNTMTSEIVTSSGRWMYVYFSSDGLGQADGFRATFTARFVGTNINQSVTYPLLTCRTFEFECSNRLCVSMSYRCDGYYDCGCGTDCDEDGCDGLPISHSLRLTIGFSAGISVFLVSVGLSVCGDKVRICERGKSAFARRHSTRGTMHGLRRVSDRNTNNMAGVFMDVTKLPATTVSPALSPSSSFVSPPTMTVTASV